MSTAGGPIVRRKQSIVSSSSGNQTMGVANVGAVGRKMSFADVTMNMTRRMSVISMMRRMSRGQGLVKEPQKVQQLENTYKMKPDENIQFKTCKVQNAIESVLAAFLDGKKYDKDETAQLSCLMASTIKNDIKVMGFNRHRLVCQVIVCENKGQGVKVVSRPLWDDKSDSFAQGNYQSGNICAIALLHGVYAE